MSSALARTQGGTGVCTQPVLGIPGLIVFSRPRSGLGVNLISTSCQPTWMSFRALLDPRVLDRSAPFHGWCRWPCRMGRYGRINYSAWDIARPYKTRPQRLRTEHMITPTQLGSLRNAISFDRPPLCSGVISPPPEGLYLWHGKKSSRLVQFSSHPRP